MPIGSSGSAQSIISQSGGRRDRRPHRAGGHDGSCRLTWATHGAVKRPDQSRLLRDGIRQKIGPHTLRHAFITAALDAGVPLRDVQEAASHADPRTTMRYDRARVSPDRHATYIVSAYIAGAAR